MISNEELDRMIEGWKSFFPQAYSTQQEVVEDFIADLEYLKGINSDNGDGHRAHQSGLL